MRYNTLCTSFFHIFLLITLFSTASSSASGQYTVVVENEKKGLLNEKGQVVIPAIHDDLGWSRGKGYVVDNVIGYQKEGKWGLVNTKNERIISPEYLELYPFDETALICSRQYYGDLTPQFGMISTKGKLVFPFQYDLIEKNNDRLILRIKERNQVKYGMVDKEGNAYLSFIYRKIKPLNITLYAATKDLFYYQLYNAAGKLVIQDSYDSIGSFSEGYASVFKNGMQGLIDENGTIIAKPIYQQIKIEEGKILAKQFPEWNLYDNKYRLRATYKYAVIEPFKKLVYKVKTNNTEALINISDEKLTEFKNYNFLQLADTLVSYSYRGKQGVMSLKGDVVVPAEFDSVFLDNPNILLYTQTTSRKGWRLADNKGHLLSNEPYDQIQRLSASLFKVKKGEFWGLLKNDGTEHVFCKYDAIDQAFEGRLKVHFFGENGIMDSEGNWIIIPQKQEIDLLPGNRYLIRSIYGSKVADFDDGVLFETDYFLYPHGDNFLEKNLDDEYSIIRKDGFQLFPTIYDDISDLQEDSLYVAKKDSAWSFISKNGQTLDYLDARFEEVHPMKEDFIGIKINGKYGFVDPNGDLRIANRYDEIGFFNNGLAPVRILGKWGFLNKIERIVIQPRYESAEGHEYGIFVVGQHEKFGIIDNTGNTIVRVEYNKIEKLPSGNFKSEMDSKLGLIDENGRILVLPRFETLSDLNNGYLIISRKGKYGLITSDGLDVISMIYDELIFDKINNLYLAKTESDWIQIK